MSATHEGGGSGSAPVLGGAVLEVGLLPGRPGIRASGEISALTLASWEEALSLLARRHADVSYVELSGVDFVDVAGVSMLAVTAMNLSGGRIVVEGPPPHLVQVLELFWPGLPGIEVAPR